MTNRDITLLNPKLNPERIAALIQNIDSGFIKLPTFQRPQVWKIGQVIDFLDSIKNGYPIGSLLFWLTQMKLGFERNIGGFQVPDTPEKHPRNYVLDGQQRLSALYAVLSHHPEFLDERFKVIYDLEQREFVRYKEESPTLHLPLNILYDTKQFLRFQAQLESIQGGDALIEEANRLWETFHDYVVPIVTVPDASIETVGTIFERINSRGTRLTIFDLMVAATWQLIDEEEFNLRERVDSVLDHLAEKDFGGIEDTSVLRALSVVTNDSAKKESILSLRDLTKSDLQVNLEKTRSALARAVDFLVTEVTVPSSDFLPYERQIILLAYLMSKKPSLTTEEFGVLRRWFWRTSFAERYRRGGEGLFDEDLQYALKALSDDTVLSRFGSIPDANFFIDSQFRKGAAAAHAFAALLASQGPRNITNGAAIDIGLSLSQYNRKEFHHLFPRAYLKSQSVDKDLINSLANICLLTASENKKIGSASPSSYVVQIRENLGADFEAVMQSNLIPAECIDLMLADDYPGFLETRAEFLRQFVAEVIG